MKEKYVAFLRGINLGKRNVKMDQLREVFSGLGFDGIQTVIASGNVMFDAQDLPNVSTMENALNKHFGFEIGVVLRSISSLEHLIATDPFAGYTSDGDTKLYLTMGANEIGKALEGVQSVPGDFDLIAIKDQDYFTAAFRQPNGRFGAGLDKLERRFKNTIITTRNWNTILKIIKKAAQ